MCQYIVPLLTPQWKQSPRSAYTQVGDTSSLKCSIAQLDSQNRKFPQSWSSLKQTNTHFFVFKQTGFAQQELRGFVKMTLNRVSSHWLWLESIHSVINVTRVESPFFSTWLVSSPSHQKSWLEPRYHWLLARNVCIKVAYMLDYFLLLHIFQTTSVNARWGQHLTHPASKLSKTNLRLDAFVCYVLVMKRMKFLKNLVFSFSLVVVYGSMYSHKDMNVNKFGIPTTKYFFKKGSVKLSKG